MCEPKKSSETERGGVKKLLGNFLAVGSFLMGQWSELPAVSILNLV
jgi:hypothetical protein